MKGDNENEARVNLELAELIFTEIDRDQSGKVSLQEFVESYFIQQVQVEERISELIRLIEEDSKKRQELVTRLEEIQAGEQVNEYGIMLNSILTARIIEGRGIKAPNGTSIIVNMLIEGQSAQTEPVQVQNGVEPVWKEVISFDIATGRENLLIQVADVNSGRLLGQGEVLMELLRDQYKHDEWIQLELPGARGIAEPAGRLRFNLHWIHSRRKFLQDILRIQDAGLEEYQSEKQQLTFQLDNMRKPFGFMQAYYEQERVLQ